MVNNISLPELWNIWLLFGKTYKGCFFFLSILNSNDSFSFFKEHIIEKLGVIFFRVFKTSLLCSPTVQFF